MDEEQEAKAGGDCPFLVEEVVWMGGVGVKKTRKRTLLLFDIPPSLLLHLLLTLPLLLHHPYQ